MVTIKERSNREVCQIFQRINSSGTTLGTLELLTAWTWSEQFDLRERIASLKGNLSSHGFEELDERTILRSLAAVVAGEIDEASLVDHSPDTLVKGMGDVESGTNAAVDFLQAEFQIRNIVFVPFPIMMIPLIAFFAKVRNPSALQRGLLRKWFWHAVFVQRFKAGTTTAIIEDLAFMNEVASSPTSVKPPAGSVSRSLFLATWRINSTAAKATICLLAQKYPKSFVTGAPVDLGTSLEAYNARQFHHIFPKSFLMNVKGVPFHLANQIANICLLTAADNNFISDKEPSQYVQSIPTHLRADVLDRALLAESDFGLDYDKFLEQRALRLETAAQKLIDDGSL